jgi:CxxC-x17-CxxC domain-containing protein
MSFTDKPMTCKECGKPFSFTAGEQEFYQQKGFQNEPQRCPDCRAAKKSQRRGPRQMFPVTCAGCGVETEVPFKPTGDRPVYCSDCFAKNRS